MSKDRARYLLSCYLKNTSTAAESQELADWMARSARDEEIRQILDELWNEFEPEQQIPEEKASRMLSQIISAPRAEEKIKVRALWWKWPAAAAVILVAGALSWNYLFKAAADKPQTAFIAKRQAVKEDVLPGTTKAMLTLSDGTRIALDTVSSGAVAFQDKARIIQKNGQLLYQNTGGPASEMIYNTLSTGRGQQYPLTLSDGTKVWLNAAASIRYPVVFGNKERAVEITGEAYFEVAKNPNRPFRVTIGDTRVEVLGTHFNINAYPDEERLNTTLLEGSVKITTGNSSMLLVPGQQAGVQKNGSIRLTKDIDPEEVISWKDGYFHFNDAGVEAILRQISRWYDVDVVYEQHHSTETFGGDIQKSLTLSQVLKILEKSQVHFRVEGRKVIVGGGIK